MVKKKAKKGTSKKKSPSRKATTRKTKKKATVKNKSKSKKKVLATPKGYHSVTPYLMMDDNATDALDFYQQVFAAKEIMRMEHAGRVAHAEIKIGDSHIMLADHCHEESNFSGPKSCQGTSIGICLYLKNVDQVVEKALSKGAKLLKPVVDQFYGDRSGTIEDPFGHKWTVSTHIEDVSPAKVRKRMAEMA